MRENCCKTAEIEGKSFVRSLQEEEEEEEKEEEEEAGLCALCVST